jgi:hypothetical protein
MKMFDDAVEKLLWPAKRHHGIKRVGQDCEIFELSGVVRGHLPGVVKTSCSTSSKRR